MLRSGAELRRRDFEAQSQRSFDHVFPMAGNDHRSLICAPVRLQLIQLWASCGSDELSA